LPSGDSEGGIIAFTRAMGAPGDRNLVDFYIDGGLAYAGPFGRKDDKIGVAVTYARIGPAARGLDADVARFTGQPFPMRPGEIVVELTYRLQLTPWW
jgi:porin